MIRPATTEDVQTMLEIYAPFITESTCSFEYTVPGVQEFTKRFQDITSQFPWLVWQQDNQVLGFAYASAPWSRIAYQWVAEPSIYLCPQAQGKGAGRQLYHALEAVLTRQGYRALYALITSENTGSIAFHTKMGYRLLCHFPDCGYKMGRWLGVTWMEKRLQPLGNPAKGPTAWDGML